MDGVGGGCLSGFVDHGSVESHRCFLARRTVLEMLRDRGYDVADAELGLSLADFRAAYGEQPDPQNLRISAAFLSDSSEKILVVFCGPDRLKVRALRSIYEDVKDDGLARMILVVQGKVTPQVRQAAKESHFKVEIFEITELLMNITKHVLKPKHEILTAEEKEDLLKKYKVVDTQLPRMLETDAIARYYGLQRGQVVKVKHQGEATGFHVTYRCIV